MPIRPAVSAVIALPNPPPSSPSSASLRNDDVVKGQVARVAGVDAEFLGHSLDRDAREAGSMRNALTPPAPAPPVRNIPMMTPA